MGSTLEWLDPHAVVLPTALVASKRGTGSSASAARGRRGFVRRHPCPYTLPFPTAWGYGGGAVVTQGCATESGGRTDDIGGSEVEADGGGAVEWRPHGLGFGVDVVVFSKQSLPFLCLQRYP